MVKCRVLLLDGTEADFETNPSAKVKQLFDVVCQRLELVEKDYFGLTYQDSKNEKIWLNNEKKLSKQIPSGQLVMTFEVKFYPPEPSILKHEITRYQLFLQLRRDILSEKLPCSFMVLALLGSYSAQSQLGDHDHSKHGSGSEYLNGIKFAPKQTQELLQKISDLHQTHRGHSASSAEDEFLQNVNKLSLYGVHLYSAKDSDKEEVSIGVCAAGLLIFKQKLRIHRFVWAKIIKISYKRNTFVIRIRPTEPETSESIFVYFLSNVKMAKRLWKIAVEHHAFFRLRTNPEKEARNMFARFAGGYGLEGRRTMHEMSLAAAQQRPGQCRRGGAAMFRSTEGLPGVSTDREEQFEIGDFDRKATLTLKGRQRNTGSLQLLNRDDTDDEAENNVDEESSQMEYSTVGSKRNVAGNWNVNRGFPGATDEGLPPYQDDRFLNPRALPLNERMSGIHDGSSPASVARTTKRTYIGPNGAVVTEQRVENEDFIETTLKRVNRQHIATFDNESSDIDCDLALNEAILAVTHVNPNMNVERIEIQTEEEVEVDDYEEEEEEEEEEDENSYEHESSETLI